jgi:uncharacterized protein (DUF111 family)
MYAAERRVHAREWVDVETRYGKVRVKVAGDGCYTPEYEDCRTLAIQSGAPLKEVLAAANFAYLQQTSLK